LIKNNSSTTAGSNFNSSNIQILILNKLRGTLHIEHDSPTTSKDRAEVMKVLKNSDVMKTLKQQIRKCQRLRKQETKSVEVAPVGSWNESFSSVSVNNDWRNWVVLRGSEKATAEDVEGPVLILAEDVSGAAGGG